MLQLQQTKPALVNHFPKPVGVCSSLYGPTAAGSVSTADAGHPPNFLFEIFVLIFSKFVLALSCIFLTFF
jgi:hypothetical protein